MELITTVGIAAIGVAIAIPGFTNLLAHNRLAAASNSVLGSLMIARQLAVTQNAFVVLCAGSPESGCNGNWGAQQWIVFVDRNRNRGFDSGDTMHSIYQLDNADGLKISGNGPFKKLVVFVPTGRAETSTGAFAAGRVRVCSPRALEPNANDLVLIGSGRAVFEAHDFSAKCPAAGSSS